MELIIVGSGTCVPSSERGSPSNILKTAGLNLLVDCGPGTLIQLTRGGVDYKDLDMVFITHFHPDHISDLVPLIHALKWTPGFIREKKLRISGPPGFKQFYQDFLKPFFLKSLPSEFVPTGHLDFLDFEIIIEEIFGRKEYGAFTVETQKTLHNKESIAYKFSSGGRSVVISGDCDYDEDFVRFSENTDLLLLECSFPDKEKMAGHLTPGECGKIAVGAGVKKLVLTHIYVTSSAEQILAETKKIFGNTILAEDFMKISI